MIRPYVKWTDENKYGMIKDISLVAEMLAKEAEKFSYLSNYMSPFAEGARAHGYECSGGKPDDITVIVAQVELADHHLQKGAEPTSSSDDSTADEAESK